MKKILFIFTVLCILFSLSGCNSGEYTISFITNDNSIKVEKIKANAGEKISSPIVSKDGYRFNGWYLDDQLYVFDKMPSEDLVLTASFSKLYTITFEIDDNKQEMQKFAENDTILFPKDMTKYKYIFSHWELDGVKFSSTKMIDRDITLKAVWNDAVTIYFDTGIYGEILEPVVGVAGDPVVYPYMPQKEGYRFAGWMHNYEDYTLHEIPKEDITLVAKWEETNYTNFASLYINIYDAKWVPLNLEAVGKENYENAIFSLENTNGFDMQYSSGLIRGRGNGSWNSAKRGYRIKLDKKTSLFGEAESRHWVLLACYSNDFQDSTMMRNALAYQMGNDIFDNIDYTTSTNWVDLYVNNEYIGAYLLVEQVRDANDRIDVDAIPGSLDSGFLIEYDAYATRDNAILGIDYFTITGVKYGFTVKSPATDEYHLYGVTEAEFRAQISYLQSEVQKMYDAALKKDFETFSKYADVDSFVDMYILHELFKNTDAGWSSFYISRVSGGKFEANCPWDFDASAGISRGDSSFEGIYVADKIHEVSNNTSSELFISLYNTPQFKELVINRWKEVSPKIISFLENNYSYSNLVLLKEGMGKNYLRWSGSTTQVGAESRWLSDAQTLISWLKNRTIWLNKEWV